MFVFFCFEMDLSVLFLLAILMFKVMNAPRSPALPTHCFLFVQVFVLFLFFILKIQILTSPKTNSDINQVSK